MRSKEKAHDYRYFPEPDLLPVHISAAWREEVRHTLPERPEARRAPLGSSFGITPYDAEVLTSTQALADYFESVVKAGAPAKAAANWMQNELLGRLNEAGKGIEQSPVSAKHFAEVILLSTEDKMTASGAKAILTKVFETGRPPSEIAAEEGLTKINDLNVIEKAAREIIAKNVENVAKYKAGNEGVFKFFVGQVMRATRGQANPQAVNDLLRRSLAFFRLPECHTAQ